MSLVVLGSKSLDEIQSEVALLFDHLQHKRDLLNRKASGRTLEKHDLPRYIELVPIYSGTRNLVLLFPIPDCTQYYTTGVRNL